MIDTMRKLVTFLAAGALLFSCSQKPSFQEVVEQDYTQRLQAHGGALAQFMTLPENLTPEEKEALEFLYAYMPLADVTDYSTDFYLKNVRASLALRDRWGVPEREFRHFVLPLRVNNEDLDSARLVFSKMLLPRIEGLSMEEAILEVNHWCHEKMTYQPSDARTHAPLASLKTSLGRCGEESTFCVAALRSVGIPARQVYTPRWAHTESNHAWVEAWAGGRWRFLGACEPEPVLDLGWFNAPASRAMLTHTKVFGKYDGPEEVVLRTPGYTEINLIGNYAESAEAVVKVLSKEGSPVADARVDFCIYNSSQFFPAVSKYTDAKGETSLSAGLGDMLAWAAKDGAYGFARVRFGKDKKVVVTLDSPVGQPVSSQLMDIVPPPEKVILPEVSPELRALNDQKLACEDSVRKAGMALFADPELAPGIAAEFRLPADAVPLLEVASGNLNTIADFLIEAEDRARAVALLKTLSRKDLTDVTPEVLWDSYNATESILAPRIENEFLTPYKGWFLENVPEDLQARFQGNAQAILDWVDQNIFVDEDPLFWDIPMSPAGVWKSRWANPRSRDLLAIALGRTFGVDLRKDRNTGSLRFSGDKADVPTGHVNLTYTPVEGIGEPEPFRHYTVSRIEDGTLRMVFLGFGEKGRRFGMDNNLPEGDYLLTSGNRLSDGSTPVTLTLFHISAGETLEVPVVIEEVLEEITVYGQFTPGKLLPVADGGYYVAAVLDVGMEPTNHVLHDIAEEKAALEAWGRPIFLICTREAQLERLHSEIQDNRYGTLPSTVVFVLDSEKDLLPRLDMSLGLSAERLPIVIIGKADTEDVVFTSQGYTIGMGAQIAATAQKL